MNTKLTLSLDKEVIEQAKRYAKEKDISLSALIEHYLQRLVATYQSDNEDEGSIVEALSGIIELPSDYDYKAEYAKHLSKKHQ
ncbi:MAG: DUF6364 family protein [Saprospiraceae bacterium]|nr:DUF6364 family protein [Saprospiraceae bacterium]